MTALLKEALARILALPEAEQNAYATRLIEELDADVRWEDLLTKHPDVLKRLAEEALEEFRRGETEELDSLLK